MVVIFLGTQNVIKYLQNIIADWFLEPILLSLVTGYYFIMTILRLSVQTKIN